MSVRFNPGNGGFAGLTLTAASAATTGTNVAIGNTTQTTVGSAGAAAAIVTPLGYLVGYVGSTKIAIPYCNG